MGIDYNLLAGMGRSGAQSHQAGLESRLITEQLEQDEMTRNVLAGYLESAPEQRDARLNALVAQSPEMAANVLTIEGVRADRARGERQVAAQAALTELKAIKSSSNPGLAFRLMAERPGEDNPLRGLMEQLQSAGAINLEDGISDEEAAQIADLAVVQLTPVAAAEDVERADPADVRAMQAFGYELTPEGFRQYNADKGAGELSVGDQLAAIQTRLQIEQREFDLRQAREASEREAETRRTQRATLRSTIRRSVTQTGEIAKLVEGLEGSFLEAGMPASTWRRTGASVLAGLGAAVGVPQDKLGADIAAFDKLKKGLSDQLINLMATGELGEATNSKLEQYQNALANTETSTGAIMSIQAGIAEALLESADANDIEVFDRDKVEANIEKWRKYDAPTREATVDVPAIAKMTVAQLEELTTGAAELTDEMIDAAEKRWDELNAAAGK